MSRKLGILLNVVARQSQVMTKDWWFEQTAVSPSLGDECVCVDGHVLFSLSADAQHVKLQFPNDKYSLCTKDTVSIRCFFINYEFT